MHVKIPCDETLSWYRDTKQNTNLKGDHHIPSFPSGLGKKRKGNFHAVGLFLRYRNTLTKVSAHIVPSAAPTPPPPKCESRISCLHPPARSLSPPRPALRPMHSTPPTIRLLFPPRSLANVGGSARRSVAAPGDKDLGGRRSEERKRRGGVDECGGGVRERPLAICKMIPKRKTEVNVYPPARCVSPHLPIRALVPFRQVHR